MYSFNSFNSYKNLKCIFLFAAATEKVPKLPALIEKSLQCKDKLPAFAGAAVPIKLFSNTGIRTWIKSYVADGDSLPSETTLRKYLKQEGDKDHNATAELCR